ncbi:MAG TPA: Uma2 family endonuclease [Longimicrobium sp.]|nr:Uma2 family endonuclease [Longimicrobium sp.]
MTMATQPHLTTADELLRMPRDGVRRELVRGELREMTPPGHVHGRVGMRLAWRLAAYVEAHELGVSYLAETGFHLGRDPDTVLAADCSFVRADRADMVRDSLGYFPGAPDLAVEVFSPSDRSLMVEAKVRAWMSAGTRMVIVVHPTRRTVAVHRSGVPPELFGENDTLDGGDVVPGWSVPVRDLFA